MHEEHVFLLKGGVPGGRVQLRLPLPGGQRHPVNWYHPPPAAAVRRSLLMVLLFVG